MPAAAEKPVPRETPTRPTFEWDGWDLVREVAPDGVETVYYAPQGEITSFKRGTSVYQVHADALGSIRAVSDATGAEVSEFDFDAWGNQIGSSSGLLNWRNRFLGGFGCQLDLDSGLIYMRRRWYSAELARFLSPDPVVPRRHYTYGRNNPMTWIDTGGNTPVLPEDWQRWIRDEVRAHSEFSGKEEQWEKFIRCLMRGEGVDNPAAFRWNHPSDPEQDVSGSISSADSQYPKILWRLTQLLSLKGEARSASENQAAWMLGIFQVDAVAHFDKILAEYNRLFGVMPQWMRPDPVVAFTRLPEMQIRIGIKILADAVDTQRYFGRVVEPDDPATWASLVPVYHSCDRQNEQFNECVKSTMGL